MNLKSTIRKALTALIFIWAVLSAGADSREDPKLAYISQWSDTAVSEMKRSGVPASITLAQGILESGSGQSELAVKANNHFGIKCHDWKGATISVDDDRKGECFRKYKRASDSFKDHSDFLRYRDRYKFLFDLEPTDYEGWAYGLRKAGYATDPGYAEKLISIIEQYNLSRFDTGRSLPDTPASLETPVLMSGQETFYFSITRKMYWQNNCPFVYSREGETLRSIAGEYNLFFREVLRYNDSEEDKLLAPGTPVYIKAKKGKAAKHVDKYVAEGGETLWEISQRYGVKLRSLEKLNKLSGGDYTLEPEQMIRLR